MNNKDAAKLDLKQYIDNQDKDVSVISPLMKLMRDKQDQKELKENKQKQKQKENMDHFNPKLDFTLKLNKLCSKTPLLGPPKGKIRTPLKVSDRENYLTVDRPKKYGLINIQTDRRTLKADQPTSDKRVPRAPRHHTNLSGNNMKQYSPMFASPEPKNAKNCLLPPIESHSENKSVTRNISNRDPKKSSSSINSYTVTSKSSVRQHENNAVTLVKNLKRKEPE